MVSTRSDLSARLPESFDRWYAAPTRRWRPGEGMIEANPVDDVAVVESLRP